MRYRITTVFLIVMVIATGLQIPLASAASSYYVATNGDDSNPGTEAQPFRTINRGASVLSPGDTLYVRGGTYHEQVVIPHSGTASNPITVSAYPGENPVIDGQDNIPGDWEYLVRLTGDYIILDGLEIKNSASIGIGITGGNHNELRNLNVHHSWYNGILVIDNSSYSLVEGCEVWWNVLENEGGTMGEGGWAIGLASRYSDYTTFRNNVVYNNWGEGISSVETEHTTIEDNVVYDNYAINIYIMNAVYTLAQRNLVYHTGDNRWYRAPGIGLCDEEYLGHARLSETTIVNNMILGGNGCLYFWLGHPDSGLKNFLIAHNTFVNSHRITTFQIASGNHQNTRIENNIFLQEDSLPIADVANDPGLHFSHNLWSKTPPSHVSSSDDVIGDPQLAKSGPTGPGLLTPEWFKLLASSPARDRAKIISEVMEDFFRNARGSNPDMGAHEYGGPPGPPTPTNTPNPTATSTPLPTNTPMPTNTPNPTPTSTPTPSPTPSPPPSACSPSPFGTEKVEAECGQLHGEMRTAGDFNASGGQYVFIPITAFNCSSSDSVKFSFSGIPNGEYEITARVYGPDGSHDAFYAQFDGGSLVRNYPSTQGSWQEYTIWWNSSDHSQITRPLNKGSDYTYHLDLSCGERGLQIDSVELVQISAPVQTQIFLPFVSKSSLP